jgi:16S rRNA (guanine966-N2)-methyltransferase
MKRKHAGPASGGSRKGATNDDKQEAEVTGVRVIGGSLRGRKLAYSGDLRTRPMKDRTREAIYNLLGEVKGMHAVDLFAGTGALGVEAISRGAAGATFFERHFPTADLLRKNLVDLGIADRATVQAGDTFLNWRRLQQEGRTFDVAGPWLVFCSPPYALYAERRDDMLGLIELMHASAPPHSLLVVEADGAFDMNLLPDAEAWRIREYWPAVVGLYRKPAVG